MTVEGAEQNGKSLSLGSMPLHLHANGGRSILMAISVAGRRAWQPALAIDDEVWSRQKGETRATELARLPLARMPTAQS